MLSLFLLAIGATLLLPNVARAGDATRKDGRDTRSALDIASVSHHYANGANVTHTLRTYQAFSGRLLRKDNVIAFAFDTNDDGKVDWLTLVLWTQGRLRGLTVDAKGRLLAQAGVSRPNSRTVSVTTLARALGGQDRGRYRWLALTVYKSKKGCAKTCTDVAPNSGLILHQLWELEQLTVSINGGGRVRTLGQGIDCAAGTCSARFRKGANVSLTATPAEGWVFGGWGGACTGTGDCLVTLDAAKTVTATFLPLYSLSVSATGPGYVKVVPPDVPCSVAFPCSRQYVGGTQVTLTAETGTAYIFDGWSGACTGTNPVCTVTMDGHKSVTAHTRIRPSVLSVALDLEPGAGGRVTSAPLGIDCPGDCSEEYTTETYVTLAAAAGPGSVFSGWKDTIWCGGTATCVLQMWPTADGNKSVKASFELGP